MTLHQNSPMVTTEWLEQHLDNEELILLDASMNKVVGKEPLIYETFSCIPRTKKIDLENELCDLTSSLTRVVKKVTPFLKRNIP